MAQSAARPIPVSEDMRWLRGLGLSTFVAFDLETTGLDPEEGSILEIGAVRFVNGKAAASFHSFVKYDHPLPPSVTELNGIRTRDVAAAPAFASISKEFLLFLGDEPLIGHTTDFHLAFLRAAGQELAGPVAYNPFAFARSPVLDIALIARTFWPERAVFTLNALCDDFDITVGLHTRAKEDARRVGELTIELVRRLPERVWRDLASDLHGLIGSTTHRSRFFFAGLLDLTKDIPKPKPVLDSDSDAELSELIEESVSELLGKHGVFERALSFFSARPMQVEMAEAVEQAFQNDEILIVEAPTGVGKSLAYLVPALRWAAGQPEAGRQVIVSSYTKMLQEQLHRKDIGEIRQALGRPFRSAVLKGRNNYLCKRRLRTLLCEAHERLSDSDRIQLMPLLRWSELTTTGDISEISAFGSRTHAFLWSQIASDSLACAGGTCSAAKGDFHRLAQERAGKAQILFINHALLFSDFARLTVGDAERRRFVLDEAHQVEKAAVAAMSIELSPLIFRNALATLVDERTSRGLLPSVLKSHAHHLKDESARLGSEITEQARNLYQSARQQFSGLGEHVYAFNGDSPRSQKIRFRHDDGWHREAARALNPFYIQWTEFGSRLNKLIDELADLRGEERLSAETLVELRSAADNVLKISEDFSRVLTEEDTDWVKWIEAGRVDHGAWCALYMSPIDVGPLMQKSIWPAVGSAVLTSATLTVADNFSATKSALGLEGWDERPVRELIVESPFRLEEQMRMAVPMYLPDPRGSDPLFVEALGELAALIVEQHHRATVILCTSNDMVERLTQIIAPAAKRAKRPLFSQGRSSSPIELLAEYRKHRHGILIGAATFWEGIDLVGESLEILIVSKIPFDVPTDPWFAARCESVQNGGKDPFREYSVPAATLRLRQGVGRLIRHASDRGFVIIADPRLVNSRYGETIRKSLPVWLRPVRSAEELLSGISTFFGETQDD